MLDFERPSGDVEVWELGTSRVVRAVARSVFSPGRARARASLRQRRYYGLLERLLLAVLLAQKVSLHEQLRHTRCNRAYPAHGLVGIAAAGDVFRGLGPPNRTLTGPRTRGERHCTRSWSKGASSRASRSTACAVLRPPRRGRADSGVIWAEPSRSACSTQLSRTLAPPDRGRRGSSAVFGPGAGWIGRTSPGATDEVGAAVRSYRATTRPSDIRELP